MIYALPIFHSDERFPFGWILSKWAIVKMYPLIESPASTTMAKYGIQPKALHAILALSKFLFGIVTDSPSPLSFLVRLLTEMPITSCVYRFRAIISIPVWSTRAHSNPYFESQYRTMVSPKLPAIFECRGLFLIFITTWPTKSTYCHADLQVKHLGRFKA